MLRCVDKRKYVRCILFSSGAEDDPKRRGSLKRDFWDEAKTRQDRNAHTYVYVVGIFSAINAKYR